MGERCGGNLTLHARPGCADSVTEAVCKPVCITETCSTAGGRRHSLAASRAPLWALFLPAMTLCCLHVVSCHGALGWSQTPFDSVTDDADVGHQTSNVSVTGYAGVSH